MKRLLMTIALMGACLPMMAVTLPAGGGIGSGLVEKNATDDVMILRVLNVDANGDPDAITGGGGGGGGGGTAANAVTVIANTTDFATETTLNAVKTAVEGTGASAQQVQGLAADNAAVVGNPNVAAGVDQFGDVQHLFSSGGSLSVAQDLTAIDGLTNAGMKSLINNSGSAGLLGVFPFVYNGTAWDRLSGDMQGLFSQLRSDDGAPVHVSGPAGVYPITPVTFNAAAPLYIPADTPVSILAGTTYIGQVGVSNTVGVAAQSNFIMDATTEAIPKFAVIDVNTSGDNTIVSAVVGKKIRVLSYTIISDGTVDVRFESGAGGTALTGQMPLIANSGMTPGYIPVGHFETAVNTLLNIELNGAVAIHGHLTYIEVD